jgi:type I restriction enzyme R subunit
LDGDDKEYGYIIDYKDLFKSLEGAVHDYTSGALDGYDKEDVAGLLEDRLGKARERLDEMLETVRALCEPVEPPKDSPAHLRFFCAKDSGNAEQLKANEPARLTLYKQVAALVRAYANLANEMDAAAYTADQAAAIKAEVGHFEKVRTEVKLASGDYIDLKMYEPAMRHLIDTYIRAEESDKVSAFDDLSLIQLIVERGPDAVNALPESIRKNEKAVAETIDNNVRKLIIDESPVNPKYYEKMSELLDALIKERRAGAISYKQYLVRIVELTRKAKNPAAGGAYPPAMNTPARKALYDNLGRNESFALQVDAAVRTFRQDDWRHNIFKVKKLRGAVRTAFEMFKKDTGSLPLVGKDSGASKPADLVEHLVEETMDLIRNQNEY